MSGPTMLPRWTLAPQASVGTHEAKIPDALVSKLGKLARQSNVMLSAVLLTAHAKVLSALSGECEIVTGYAVPGERPVPCRLTTEPRTWREILLEVHRAELEVLSRFPLDDLRSESGRAKGSFETLFELSAARSGEPDEDIVVCVGFAEEDGRLRLRYRTDAFDADGAARIAGYHLTALSAIAADPDADHAEHTLLSAEELHFQIDGLAGPRRPLPDRRLHELFEERVRLHPDAIAAAHGSRQWTYEQLNARANQIARALLTRGLRREGIVAVVTERNLQWMAAVLAIFKAGGVYLPIEPHFPTDRIARTLSRAGCGFVLTEPGSTATLERALDSLDGVRTLFIDAAFDEGHDEGDVGIDVAADQLAYIYFTSGSTGEPKGAMCEHAGMLNHVCAKIDDLRIRRGDVVAQTAPQCFDISLWQLMSALLAGGRTLIVEQDTVLDASRFISKIIEGHVGILQVVPSYLEVILSQLAQHPRELPHLRYVSVTGEALKKELAQRWFALQPTIKLVNAYGLTETSDDTNHHVMDCAPSGARVPLGRPINNVRVYVVDEYLSPVPLGAPGELLFSGICVGRGYVNDPERTARAFLTDPHRPGERIYRSGDYGRWLPDGTVEFMGRRDSQVKISGFRIEIGEIENTLLRVPGVRDGAVVVTERADGVKQLVAFYASETPLNARTLRDHVGRALPEYMVPSLFHWQQSMPLTANGKVDRNALAVFAGRLDPVDADRDRPCSATERRVAAAWADVLGIRQDQIGRGDHFFDLGGTSLSALKLAITLNRVVSFKDIAGHPTLADLAAIVDARSEERFRAGGSSVDRPAAVASR